MKKFKKILLVLILIILSILAIYISQGYKMYKNALDDKPLEEMVQGIRNQKSYTKISNIPDIYKDAVIAVEDHRYYDHKGIDIIAIGRALLNDIRARELIEGGSTITQQLAKNMYFTQDKTLTRKIVEAFMAKKIENNYNKEEILELYVNYIYYGSGYYDKNSSLFIKIILSFENDFKMTFINFRLKFHQLFLHLVFHILSSYQLLVFGVLLQVLGLLLDYIQMGHLVFLQALCCYILYFN